MLLCRHSCNRWACRVKFLVLTISRSIQLCVSANVYAEYEEVVQRPRLRLDKELIVRILSVIRETALWVVPKEIVRRADSEDDIFVGCTL